MNGLDKLKEKIMREAYDNADTIIADAKRRADKISAEFEEKAKAEGKRILDDADKKAEIIVRSATSDATLCGRKKILKEKRRIMDEVFETARKTAAELPDSDYFELIYSIAEKCGRGELFMSENDKFRLPADFEEKIKLLSNGEITVSKDFADIKNGFVLKNGMTEEDCSFDGIIDAKSEKLQDMTARILFPKN